MEFGERLSPTAAIASILSAYPFSVGLLRELLQNADDAKASKQIFVLDSRTHPENTLYDKKLADTQGPALLAWNNASFSEKDWEAIQTVYESSKTADTSKIGKYGIGFRSCYHVTDNPQILSGSTLAIFDPHHAFTSSGGTTIDWAQNPDKYADQLSGFSFFLPPSDRTNPFANTVIRLPLRTAAGAAKSCIKKEMVEPAKMRQLFNDFIKEELSIVPLFLTHVSCIEIYEIDDHGEKCLATAQLIRNPPDSGGVSSVDTTTYRCNVDVTATILGSVSQSWRILHATYSDSEAATLLSDRLGYDVGPTLKAQKLLPKVGIAIPIPSSPQNDGRLYTYLPLPLSTGFPCHVHGLFALTPDRQHLRNGEETGVVEGVDSVLVAWNRLLFDTFIPSAWATLLPILLTHDKLSSIFEAWPPSQPLVQGGDTMYWNSLPCNVLRAIIKDKLAVWPTIESLQSARTARTFLDLDSVLVASCNDDKETLAALTVAGVNMTQPPDYVRALLLKVKADFISLSPNAVRQVLLQNIQQLRWLDSEPFTLDCILSYLLSTNDLTLIIKLPLIRLVNGNYVALDAVTKDGPVHTLLTAEDMKVWSGCDQNAIDVIQLPSTVGNLLMQIGSNFLNVKTLTCGRVVEYLRTSFVGFGLDLGASSSFATVQVPDSVIDWLSLFWSWLGDWPLRFELYPAIRGLHLVPTSRNKLVTTVHGVFTKCRTISTITADALEGLGIAFLHPGVADGVRLPLDEQSSLKSATNGHHIIDSISLDHAHIIGNSAADGLRDHLLLCLTDSIRRSGPLNADQRRKLRSLPIFPVLLPPVSKTDSPHAVRKLQPILEGKTARGILDMPLLPAIKDVIFLDGCRDIIGIIQSSTELLRANDVLSLAVDHFVYQPRHLQRAFVEYVNTHRSSVTMDLMQKISKTAFVAVCGDSQDFMAPKDIFDPDCEVATLLRNDYRCPRLDDDNKAIVRGLSSLGLLRSKLDNDIIHDRITYISQSGFDNNSISRRLLELIIDKQYDCSTLWIDPNARWLPTSRGLFSARECHHHDAHPAGLFDEVLPVLDVQKITASLSKSLGWHWPLAFSVIKEQLERVLLLGQQHKLSSIINHLGQRVDLTTQNINELRRLVSGHPWIPISRSCIATTSHAVFNSAPFGFHMIPASFSDNPNTRRFLQLMGCTTDPSPSTLLKELNNLKQLPSNAQTVNTSVALLQALVKADLNDEQRAQLIIPDINGQFYPISQVHYNDLGDRAYLVPLPSDVYLASKKIDADLALALRVTFLGLSGLELRDENDEEDMGEELTTRINNVLRQYTTEQAFGEFVSNAVDAKATAVGILIDERPGATSSLLSQSLAQLQGPSLVIHNNALFEDKDFRGIRRIGRGGKEGRNDTIGQFGLGSLSMFHFAEVAMIISGDKVMFLDPSKGYLKFSSRAAIMLPLLTVKKLYTDHVTALDGLFGFDVSETEDFYPGTIFRLPLRTVQQASRSLLSRSPLTAMDLQVLILGHYWNVAPETLLFTELCSISALRRDPGGTLSEYWRIESTRSANHHEEAFQSKTVKILGINPDKRRFHDEWNVVSRAILHSDLPGHFLPLIRKYRVREPIMTGLAANLTHADARHKLFSALPLPLLTSLSAHVNGSFILAEDRRSIRFDGDGQVNPESQYNRWLLADQIPQLYLFLLEILLQIPSFSETSNWSNWWPGSSQSQQDPITNVLVDSFYSRFLAATERRICCSIAGDLIQPREAVLFNKRSPISKIILHLRPHHIVQLPSGSKIKGAIEGKIEAIAPKHVRKIIMQNVDCIQIAFREKKITVLDIEGIVRFLMEDGESTLDELPLLPLSDATLTKFEYSKRITAAYIFVWPSSPPSQPLFPLGRFVDPNFNAQSLLDKNLNVLMLNGAGVKEFLEARMPQVPFRKTEAHDKTWINLFWKKFGALNISADYISGFPLVPTTRPSYFVSLAHCKTSAVVTIDRNEAAHNWLVDVLNELGMVVVRKDLCNTSVNSILDKDNVSGLSMQRVLLHLKSTMTQTIHICLPRLEMSTRHKFYEWARANIELSDKPKMLLNVARSLAIWPALGSADGDLFIAASRLNMLPFGIHPNAVVPFLRHPTNFVKYWSKLEHVVQQKPLTLQELRTHLELPQTLSNDNLPSYKRLLSDVILPNNMLTNLLVPNNACVMVQANTLYSRSEPIFNHAFSTRPRLFIHKSLQDLETGLEKAGLNTQIGHISFRMCAQVLHEDSDGELRFERACFVYQWYSEVLPIQVGSNLTFWRTLDPIRFIPRHTLRHRSGSFDPAQYARSLPELISPLQVLRPIHEAVAWTQRGFFSIPPDERLLLADLELGVPSVTEVVEHLRVLVLQVAQDYPGNSNVVYDITETYRWLEGHKDQPELGRCISKYNRENLFLNVDDPKLDIWRWHCADQLFFDIDDGKDQFDVKRFLLPFSGLLRLAGVEQVISPPRPSLLKSSAETQLFMLRSTFDNMRRNKSLTDVVLTTEDGANIAAHRVLLATTSDYFKDMFCGSYAESQVASPDDPINLPVKDCSAGCLECALDFIYTGTTPTLEDPNDLLQLLFLSHYWRISALSDSVQCELVGHVSIHTYKDLREAAQKLDANTLIDACKLFEKENFRAIRKLKLYNES